MSIEKVSGHVWLPEMLGLQECMSWVPSKLSQINK